MREEVMIMFTEYETRIILEALENLESLLIDMPEDGQAVEALKLLPLIRRKLNR